MHHPAPARACFGTPILLPLTSRRKLRKFRGTAVSCLSKAPPGMCHTYGCMPATSSARTTLCLPAAIVDVYACKQASLTTSSTRHSCALTCLVSWCSVVDLYKKQMDVSLAEAKAAGKARGRRHDLPSGARVGKEQGLLGAVCFLGDSQLSLLCASSSSRCISSLQLHSHPLRPALGWRCTYVLWRVSPCSSP